MAEGAGGMLGDMSDEIGQIPAWDDCLEHCTVETEGECKATDRLGPYPSPGGCSRKLWSLFKERENQLEAEDRPG